MTTYKISGLPRRKLKHVLRALKKQSQRIEGLSDADALRMADIEKVLKEK